MTSRIDDTAECQSGAHCTTCRDLHAGRWLRVAWIGAMDLAEPIDFDCPAGHAWGDLVPLSVRGETWRADQAEKARAAEATRAAKLEQYGERGAACVACEDREGMRCGVLRRRGLAGHLLHERGLPDPDARCPAGKW